MPAVDILFSRVNRQFAEVEQSLRRLEDDPSDSSCFASISASLGTLSRSMNDLEQVLKRETMFKEQYKMSFKKCEVKFAQYKAQFDAMKSQRLEIERRRRRNELPPDESKRLVSFGEDQYTHERDTLDKSNTQVDQVIDIGGYTLERLRNQGKTMKAAHKKALDAAMSLDIGKNLIRVIGRKSKEDKIIFYTGVLVLLIVFYFCWKVFVK